MVQSNWPSRFTSGKAQSRFSMPFTTTTQSARYTAPVFPSETPFPIRSLTAVVIFTLSTQPSPRFTSEQYSRMSRSPNDQQLLQFARKSSFVRTAPTRVVAERESAMRSSTLLIIFNKLAFLHKPLLSSVATIRSQI
jgi:hypothetical protein